MNPHTAEVPELSGQLETSIDNGLSETEASQRLARYGPNELPDRGGKNALAILWDQLTGVMTLVLVTSAVISIFLKD
ncbi:MAG: cation-transporting P-type ATPase, partial [Omnitrophica WOR_2 bacterium]